MKTTSPEKATILKVVEEIIEPKLAEVRDLADELVGSYRARIRAENARRPNRDDHACLTPYVTRNANGYAYLYWAKYQGWRTEGGRRLKNTKHIRTATNGDYTEGTLSKYAQSWELPHVLEMEEQFRVVRKRQTHLGHARLSLANLVTVID